MVGQPPLPPFPSFDLLKEGLPQNSMFVTAVDFGELISPLLQKLPTLEPDDASNLNASQGPRLSRKKQRGRDRKQRSLLNKISQGLKHAATYVVSDAAFKEFPTTATGWAGKDVRYKTNQKWLLRAWKNRTLLSSMLQRGFKLVPFDDCPTWFVDKNGIIFGYRTDVPAWMTERVQSTAGDAGEANGQSSHREVHDDSVLDDTTLNSDSPRREPTSLLEDIGSQCVTFIIVCGDILDSVAKENRRGLHWFCVTGVDRQISSDPKFTKFHLDHFEATKALMVEGSPIRRLVMWAKEVFAMHFKALAARVDNCEKRLLAMGYEPEIAKPQYGYWYNFCINGARSKVKGVSTSPHADAKNLALMMCVVFVYGKFNSKEKAWLVLWEAGLIIEVPPGALIYYPSSLFTHFNVDITDLQFVTTSDGSLPTRKNACPLTGVDGRGSIVLFNQASLFQLAELGYTIQDGQNNSLPTSCDNEEFITRLPIVDLY